MYTNSILFPIANELTHVGNPYEPLEVLTMDHRALLPICLHHSGQIPWECLVHFIPNTLIFLKPIPPGIDEADCDPDEDIHLVKRLLYDNSSPRPPKEIDLSFNSDDPMPPGIEEDEDDSERDIPILEELLDNYSFSLPDNESYHFHFPSPYRPLAKPPDGNT
nr:hypothetical protein [Tanacetum cinerariifolium]